MTIELRRLAPAAAQAWATLFDLAEESPDSWILVGGQMILLLALEHGEDSVRPSQDMDIVVNVRVRPDGTRWLSAWLEARGFDLEGINRDQIGHRFVKAAVGGQGNVVIDVLAPAGVGERARLTTIPPARTVQAPGALQAFGRSRLVDILISDSRDGNERRGAVKCPDILGALVLKAAATSIPLRENADRDWQDAAFLLSIIADPFGTAERVVKRDRHHLCRLRPLLDESHAGWTGVNPQARLRGAAALSFLID